MRWRASSEERLIALEVVTTIKDSNLIFRPPFPLCVPMALLINVESESDMIPDS